MNIINTNAITATIVLAVGIAIYTACQASKLRNENQTLRQQKVLLNNQITELEAALDRAKAKLRQGNENIDGLATRVQEYMKRDSALMETLEKPAKPEGAAALFGGDRTNSVSGAMSEIMKTVMEQQIEGKMSALKTKLNLTPEQEATIREILTRSMGKVSETAQQMFNGDGVKTNDFAQIGKDTLTKNDSIKALLTPEQATAYDAFQEAEQDSNIRLMANLELAQLQSTLQLDEAQKDKVFAALVEQARAQSVEKQTHPDAAIDLRGLMQRKAEALRPMLTPEQFESYQKFQEQQLNYMEKLLGHRAGQ